MLDFRFLLDFRRFQTLLSATSFFSLHVAVIMNDGMILPVQLHALNLILITRAILVILLVVY